MEIQLATAPTNNDDQNTQKDANISGGNESKNEELVIELRKMVEGPEIQSSVQCRIYEVPHYVRKWNEEAYTPQVISIGPFHRKNKRLKVMEKYKERYFRGFVKRSNINLHDLVDRIRKMEESIRGCYEETIDLRSDRFVKMILMDVSFILELFIRCSLKCLTSDDSMFVLQRAKAIMLDLLLLENQLPFFVIEELYNLAFPSSDYGGLLQLSFHYFSYFNQQSIAPYANMKIEHFTDLLRTFQIPPSEKLPKRDDSLLILPSYSATQLYQAGIKFEVVRSKNYFDMKFENGVLKLPSLELNDWTAVAIPNIMALEQTLYVNDAFFTDHFLFMDSLIRTRKDVDLLCDKNILVNYLGDSYAAESLINNLNRGILCLSMRVDHVDLSIRLNRFCENPWNKWRALLIRTYFTSSSDLIYVVHNILIMTLLTIIQTICSIIQVGGPISKPK